MNYAMICENSLFKRLLDFCISKSAALYWDGVILLWFGEIPYPEEPADNSEN